MLFEPLLLWNQFQCIVTGALSCEWGFFGTRRNLLRITLGEIHATKILGLRMVPPTACPYPATQRGQAPWIQEGGSRRTLVAGQYVCTLL